MHYVYILCRMSSASDKITHHMNPMSDMLRFKLKELVAEKEFRERRVVTLVEVAEVTGIHRMTLSRISNNKNANPTADVLNRLCRYFSCSIDKLVEYIPE